MRWRQRRSAPPVWHKESCMGDIIAIAAIAAIIGGALAYIVFAKKSGKKCIGCPDSSACCGKCSACAYRKKEKE